MAIGAYTAAILASQAGLPLGVSFVVALVVAALVAFPFGLAVLRLRDVYLAIATLGFVQIVNVLLLNGDKVLRAITGNEQPGRLQRRRGDHPAVRLARASSSGCRRRPGRCCCT